MYSGITEQCSREYIRALAAEGRSAATLAKYARDTAAFARYARGGAITKELAAEYREHLCAKYAPRSVNSMLAAVNGFLAFAGYPELRVRQVRVQRQAFCAEERELTKAEYTRLCKAAERRKNSRLCLLLQTMCGTGIRVSELQFITVESVRCGEAAVNCKGKMRVVFIVRELRKKLLRYAAARGIKSGSIFITRSGKPMGRTNIWREMKSLCRAAGVNERKVFPHNLRHLFARVFYAQEKDIAKLADILGHSSINTTRIYIISTGAEHRRCMERMRLIM